jgi:hypothetical protein
LVAFTPGIRRARLLPGKYGSLQPEEGDKVKANHRSYSGGGMLRNSKALGSNTGNFTHVLPQLIHANQDKLKNRQLPLLPASSANSLSPILIHSVVKQTTKTHTLHMPYHSL